MKLPLLIIVTGRPASGKTTLAHLLSQKIKCPLLSRDEIKEGYINTHHVPHSGLGKSVATHIYHTFFETIELFISKEISVIAEAAFQDKVWKSKLLNIAEKAEIKIIICQADADVLKIRFASRFLNDSGRKKFHGDAQTNLLTDDYQTINMNVPTLQVDTTKNYSPDLEKIIRFIQPFHKVEL